MSHVPFDSVPIDEQREPLVALSRYPFVVVPVYHHHLWAASPELFARRQLAEKLLSIQERQLDPVGLRWVVYDAWRPREVQAAVYQHYWREFSMSHPQLSSGQLERLLCTYVTVPADPDRVPGHSTGGSVDLGLWDCNSDRLVPMGAEFDEFSTAVAARYYEQPGRSALLRDNRRRMAEWLMQSGIVSDADEYFHKDFGNQKWAYQAAMPRALYGEVLSCKLDRETGRVVSVFGADESDAAREHRVAAIGKALDLSHPAERSGARLAQPADLVRQVAGFADVPF